MLQFAVVDPPPYRTGLAVRYFFSANTFPDHRSVQPSVQSEHTAPVDLLWPRHAGALKQPGGGSIPARERRGCQAPDYSAASCCQHAASLPPAAGVSSRRAVQLSAELRARHLRLSVLHGTPPLLVTKRPFQMLTCAVQMPSGLPFSEKTLPTGVWP